MRYGTLVIAVAIGFGAGCGGVEPLPPGPGDVQIEAGSAAADGSGFVPVDDGVEVALIPGSQGGFHVWLGMRVRGVSGRLRVEREARRVSDDALVYRGLAQPVDLPDEALDGWWESPLAAPAFMCPSPIGIQVFDHELRFTVRLLDEDDTILAEDQVILMPRCPTNGQEAFCRDICAG